MNKIIIIGNLTKDVDLRTTQNDIEYCTFTVAVKRKYQPDETDFLNVVAYRNLAKTCSQYLSKGKKVCVCGYLQTRSYEVPDGGKKYVTEIIAEEVDFLSGKSEEQKEELKPVPETDDLPF